MHLRVDERRTLNTLNRNNAAATIRFPMKGKINSRQMKLNCIIQAVLGCLPITDPSLNQEAMKVMRIAIRICKCLVAYVTRPDIVSSSTHPQYYATVLNSLILAKCIEAHLWENSPYVSKQLKGIGPTFSTLLATAGKVNFTLIEESHPRDLERIINKGAPVGNVIRKQVGLLPKYQLITTPIDENSVSVRLKLLNQHHLAENRDNLTAGDTHKCYVLAGDSENNLLLFTSFKDNDLISVFDGIINYQITRKHSFEHKVFVHCVSSNWVGIDVQCDYEFKDLDPIFSRGEASKPIPPQQVSNKKTPGKQTMITDVYKERKRKSNDLDITQSKEKKKRDNSLIEKFKHLRNAFAITSKELKAELQKSAQISNKIISEMIQPESNSKIPEKNIVEGNVNSVPQSSFYNDNTEDHLDLEKEGTLIYANDYAIMNMEDLTEEESFIVDEHIDSLLNEIENEISNDINRSPLLKATNNYASISKKTTSQQIKNTTNIEAQSTLFNENIPRKANNKMLSANNNSKLDIYKSSIGDTRKRKHTRSNFSIIDLIEQKGNSNEEIITPKDHSGFSETIRTQVETFLKKTSTKTYKKDIAVMEILESSPPMEKLSLERNPDVKIINDSLAVENNSHISPELPDVLYKDFNTETENLRTSDIITSSPKININTANNEYRKWEDLENIPEKESCSVWVTDNVDKNEIVNDNAIDGTFNDKCNSLRFDDDWNHNENIKNMELVNLCEENQIEINELKESNVENIHNRNESVERCATYIAPNNKITAITNDLKSTFDATETQVKILCKSIPTETLQYSNAGNMILSLNMEDRLSDQLERESFCKEASNISSNTNTPSDKTTGNSRDNHTKNLASDFFPNDDQIPKEYIKRFTFSTTKIDVQTKHTPDRQIRIIRKLQLGLDVTEIVYEGDKIHQKESKKTDEVTTVEQGNQSTICTTHGIANIESEKNINRQKGCKKVDTLLHIDDNKLDPSNNAVTNTSHHAEYPKILTHLEDSSITRTDFKTISDDCGTENNSNSEKENANNKIENILQKYRTLLRKNNNILNNFDSKSFYKDGTKHAPAKIKKPYKITDIHNLEVPLPKNLIDVSTTRNSAPENAKVITRIKILGKEIIKPSASDLTNKLKDPVSIQHSELLNVDTEDDNQEIFYENISYCTPPVTKISHLESDDFDIDQSMLNPKTLLQQCFSKDKQEDILPPPMEFCDDVEFSNVHSPKKSKVNSHMESASQDLDVSEERPVYVVTDMDYNRSIFEDNKDIETWLLPQDESDGHHQGSQVNFTYNPIKSCTLMRKASPVNELYHNKGITSNAGQSKLEQFKFMNKSKLKI